MKARLLFFLSLVVMVMAAAAPGWAQPSGAPDARLALVIGNAAYSAADGRLTTPVMNARALADELRRMGFSDVEEGLDLTKETMRQAIDRFARKIRPGAVALIFFSGHGIQVDRQSYLLPVDAQIGSDDEVRRDGVSINSLLAEMHARGGRANIAILDASRTNPFARRLPGVSGGLAPVDAPSATLVMYSAAPGQVADDGDGPHSVFVEQLIKEMRVSGLTTEETFSRTRIGVSRVSGGRQVPWISSSLVEDILGRPRDLRAWVGPGPQAKPEPPHPDRPEPRTELTDLFPWPPPTPSTRRSFSPDILADSPPAPSAGDVAARLETLLGKAEFDTWGYFRTPGGFALVTRAERLDAATGKPLAGHQRWSDQIAPAGITLSTIFGWSRPRGLYRVLVFILTDDPPMSRPLGAAETLELTRRWPLTGRASLPAAVRADVVGQSHQLVALVYEFETGQGSTTTHNVPSRWSLDHHLQTVGMSLKPLR